MPTADRRGFARQAIAYFLRQDYADRELVIVDDGDDAVGDLVPADPRVRYHRLDRRMALGAKRNIACELSRGDVIVHWDDDDWMSPRRISVQVAALRSTGADLCGWADLLHYSPRLGGAWLYRTRAGGRRWVAGCSLAYRRSAWTTRRFLELDVGEDSAFVFRFDPDRIHVLEPAQDIVALLHERNTGPKNLVDPHWERRPVEEALRLLANDLEFYGRVRNGGTSLEPGLSRDRGTTVTVGADLLVCSGYGSMVEHLVTGMVRHGVSVAVQPFHIDRRGYSAELLRLVDHPAPPDGGPRLYFTWPRPDLERFAAGGELFINTMWESSRLPVDWPARLDRARTLIVPTRFVADVCRASGVTVPIEVIPEGVDPGIYHPEDRGEREGITTLIVATVVPRKHTLRAIAAWKRAFDGDASARLIIKNAYEYGNYAPDDPRIELVTVQEPVRGIAHWYRRADVLLALGSEGFGLPLVEGMATGLPVVALTSEGQGDVCADAGDLVLRVEPESWEPANDGPWGECGLRGVPSVEQAAERLRWVARHREEARALGSAASSWALRHRDVSAKAPAVLDVMERHITPPRPLRRLTGAFMVASWGRRCGIAEYTRHLSAHLPHVQVSAALPAFQGIRVLHVQHEFSLFDDDAMCRAMVAARAAGVPVAVTEHSVTSRTCPWEPDTDMVVSLTRAGAGRLRERLPGRRVEHIAMGCPLWSLPVKPKRGRVLGVFGFLEQHKGFTRALDVLSAVRGTELLMFSHAKSQGQEEWWEAAAAGLPVRRIRDYLPVETVARHLAREADVLLFWYDDVDVLSASAAVRVGLSTGVPVLTSPTSWFADLRDVTYQPDDLVSGVRRLLEDDQLRSELTQAALEHCHENSWARTAERHRELWQTLTA